MHDLLLYPPNTASMTSMCLSIPCSCLLQEHQNPGQQCRCWRGFKMHGPCDAPHSMRTCESASTMPMRCPTYSTRWSAKMTSVPHVFSRLAPPLGMSRTSM